MPWKKNSLKKSRLYLILDTEVCGYERLLTILKDAVGSGVDIVQLRDKKGTEREVLKFSHAALKIIRRKIPLIINDRLDLALSAGADGVHVGQDDMAVGAVRKLSPKGFLVGASCQSLEQALKAQNDGADYIGFGSVFKTLTKPRRVPMDLNLLQRVLKSVRVPVFAIGGISSNNLSVLRPLGVNRAAVCRDICLAKDVPAAVLRIRRELELQL